MHLISSLKPYPDGAMPTLKSVASPEIGSLLWCFNATFMVSVGLLKSLSYLRHPLSPIAGLLELVGGALLLASQMVPARRTHAMAVLGHMVILGGLGVIISTRKRSSPVCWIISLLNLYLVNSSSVNRSSGFPMRFVAGTVIWKGGQIFGEHLQMLGVDEHVA